MKGTMSTRGTKSINAENNVTIEPIVLIVHYVHIILAEHPVVCL